MPRFVSTATAAASRQAHSYLLAGTPASRFAALPAGCRGKATLSGSNVKTPAFAFDMDGVLIRGGKALPNARRALEKLRGDNPQNKEIPFIVLTNSGGESEASKAEKLSRKLGLKIDESQFIISSTPMRTLVPKHRNDLVHVVGPHACKALAQKYGFKNVLTSREIRDWNRHAWPFHVRGDEHPQEPAPHDLANTPVGAILIMHDPPDWGLDIQLIMDLLLSHRGDVTTRRNPLSVAESLSSSSSSDPGLPPIPLYSSNADFLWANEHPHPRLGQGGFLAALRGVWAQMVDDPAAQLPITTQFGKPSAPTYDYAKRVLGDGVVGGVDAVGDVYMIGDNPESDIRGANANGWVGVLVETGVYKHGDALDGGRKPAVVVKDVEAAVDWVLEKEGVLN
ncbi:hypothetical protein HDU87_000090 [Geranomyces variabilis]|uniref:Uncharacterized protein n=1 Tax=Geranomyces variabilis TaxID=109894 RepID=A0AAD5TRZ9_9FUNG|nr:hypothetical protein HDU87_000090 [Geranomyces variabilis]